MPCAIFCFDVTKENRQELRQRGLLASKHPMQAVLESLQ